MPTQLSTPGYLAGTWAIDTARTKISCDDFGVTRGPVRAIAGDNVEITLAVQASKQD
ncbi:MAG TPA: hypothetical protein VGZ32_27860 [Actinocrinis sp.]|jgi:hypothetical protein|uniref:hypothetical protein n=1 Tax=Actinocrinis sp. TaxID=1920516 RepID=UPI002DDDB639|nr:hypothetical protein [Actinocrinis sp.]HEV3174197.1 hypothetical protein [Actinocrinis sp.]